MIINFPQKGIKILLPVIVLAVLLVSPEESYSECVGQTTCDTFAEAIDFAYSNDYGTCSCFFTIRIYSEFNRIMYGCVERDRYTGECGTEPANGPVAYLSADQSGREADLCYESNNPCCGSNDACCGDPTCGTTDICETDTPEGTAGGGQSTEPQQ